MLDDNKDAFEQFEKVHNSYQLNQKKWQREFNSEGEKILEIVREYENRLCANTERGMYNKFSAGLSEKFRNEVRKLYPMIDNVGIIHEEGNSFNLKKITLI